MRLLHSARINGHDPYAYLRDVMEGKQKWDRAAIDTFLVCTTCEVRVECLEYALEHRIDHGVWGGASERERRRIMKARRVRVAVAVN